MVYIVYMILSGKGLSNWLWPTCEHFIFKPTMAIFLFVGMAGEDCTSKANSRDELLLVNTSLLIVHNYTSQHRACTPCCFVIRISQGSATASIKVLASAHLVALLLESARDQLQPPSRSWQVHTLLLCY